MSRTTITRINNRHDTAENWETKNPILGVGEIGYDETSMTIRIGDGVTPWNELKEFVTKTGGTFASMSWEEISRISVEGEARKYFNIGDTKTIELSTGEEIEVRIIGFNHDERSDGSGTAGITCEMVEELSTTYPMNNTQTATGGWPQCVMRTSTLPTIFNQLPSDLQSAILKVNKKAHTEGSYTNETATSQDKLFLFSVAEIYAKDAIEDSTGSQIQLNVAGLVEEGTQYEYYANEIGDQDPATTCNALVKHSNGSAQRWWLRSRNSGGGIFFDVYTSGNVNNNNANNTNGVSFGFCV